MFQFFNVPLRTTVQSPHLSLDDTTCDAVTRKTKPADRRRLLDALELRPKACAMKHLTKLSLGLLALVATAHVAPAFAASKDAPPQCGDEKKGTDTKGDKKGFQVEAR